MDDFDRRNTIIALVLLLITIAGGVFVGALENELHQEFNQGNATQASE